MNYYTFNITLLFRETFSTTSKYLSVLVVVISFFVVSLSQQSPWFDAVHLNDVWDFDVTHTNILKISSSHLVTKQLLLTLLYWATQGLDLIFLFWGTLSLSKYILSCKPACRGP